MNEFSRYHRQMILKGFGYASQKLLAEAAVLVIGAGGLGCPVLQYLVGAGVGKIGIVDGDTVALHNLHRQVLFSESDIGENKAIAAAAKLKMANSSLDIEAYDFMLDNKSCISLFEEYELIVDGSDNFSTRYMVNDACVLLQKPLVFGAVSQYQGQVAVFNLGISNGSRSANYRQMFPVPPQEHEVNNCAEAGVMGMLPGVIGAMMALEAIKIITAIGKPATNQIIIHDCLTNQQAVFAIPNGNSGILTMPKSVNDFLGTDYKLLCGVAARQAFEITMLPQDQPEEYVLIDVRALHEEPRLTLPNVKQIPLPDLNQHLHKLKDLKTVFICQSGKRSISAAEMMLSIYPDAKVFSLAGGVNKLVNT